jgi:hypothetical protein
MTRRVSGRAYARVERNRRLEHRHAVCRLRPRHRVNAGRISRRTVKVKITAS